MRDIEVHAEREEDAVTVHVSGDLDIGTVDEVERLMQKEERNGCRELVLDLSALRFIDSTGLRLVISAHSRARDGGWRFAIVPGPRRVHRVFQISGLDDRLPFTEEQGDGDEPD